ncbi:recombinase family protein [Bacillus glycinifermentans]|nr:recombinase family protein [Bacillus glycinifermentans]
MSTDKQVDHGTSLEYQREACFKKAKELNVPDDLIILYEEKGFSGEDIERPEMDKLREDIRRQRIERIIIVHPDRLSRNMIDRLLVCTEFEKNNVELIFVDTEYKNTEEGKLFFNIQSSIAEYELALIKKRTRRGTIKAVKNGFVMPMRVPPYGYDYVDRQLVINKEEAKFVRKIFQWYVYDKLTIREIGELLSASGAKTKRTKSHLWNASTIGKILKNETYVGKFYYNRRDVKKIKGEKTKSGKPKRTYETRDKEEWIEISVPAIVDFATFGLAENQRIKNTKHSGNIKHEYLLRKMIRCAHCGAKYSSYTTTSKTRSRVTGEVTSEHKYKNYRCVNKNGRIYGVGAKKCCSKILKAREIEKEVWEIVYDVIYDPSKIVSAGQSSESNNSIKQAYDLLKFKQEQIAKERKRILQLFKKGYIEEDEMDSDIQKLNEQEKLIKIELSKYEDQLQSSEIDKQSKEKLIAFIEKIKDEIKNSDKISFETKRKIVTTLIDEIIVEWINDQYNISFLGIISKLIENTGTQKEMYYAS